MDAAGSVFATLATGLAWLLGPALLGAGLLGWGSVPGTVALLAGLLVTPRTRRELAELRSLWRGAS